MAFPARQNLVEETEASTPVKSHGLEWAALRMAPWEWTYRWMLGLEGANEQIENYKKTIRSVGEAGIGLLIYNMHALRIYRTSTDAPERAGARATRFKMLDVEGSKLMEHPSSGVNTKLIRKNERRPITDQMLWENLRRFLANEPFLYVCDKRAGF